MAGWVSSYHYGGHTYNRGDAIVLKGNYYYDITDSTPNGTLNNETLYFYGVFVFDDGSLPLNPVGLMNYDYNDSPSRGTCRFSDIVSGGTPDKHTVSFNANGGTGAPSSQTKVYGSILTLSSTVPTRTGYTFQGWGTSASDTTVDYAAGGQFGLDQDTTLYAIWSINKYTLTINPNGGSWGGTTANTAAKQDYGSTKNIDNPTRSGYRFTGWTLSGSGTFKNGTYTYAAGNGTLKANWVAIYYLDLNVYLNGSVINDPNIFNCDVAVGGTTVGTNVCDYYKEHDTGSKWSITGLTTASGYTRYSTGTTSGTLTAKAVCSIYIGKNYTITYNANGGSGATTQGVNYGTAWTTKGAICTKAGYTQTSWNTKADGSGTKYSLNTKQTNAQDSNLTLYAIYTANTYENTIEHQVTGFKNKEGNGNGGLEYKLGATSFEAVFNNSYKMDSSRKRTVPNGLSLRNTYGSSSITSDGSWATYDIGTSVKQPAKDAIYYYYYDPINYSITYELDGGTNNAGNPSTYNVLYGVALKEPTRNNYKFLGWYLNDVKVTGINEGCNASFTSADDLYAQLAKRSTGNITLVAKWEMIANFYIKDNGAYKPGICYEKHNGVYKRTQVLAKDAGSYKYGGCS